jgi:hypothetical protein
MDTINLKLITPLYNEVSKFNKYYRLILPYDNRKSNFPYCEEIFIRLLKINLSLNNKYTPEELNEMMYCMFYSKNDNLIYVITPETHEHIKCMLFGYYCECQYCRNEHEWKKDGKRKYIYIESKNEK